MKPEVQKNYQLEISMVDGEQHIFELGKVVAYEFTEKGMLYVQVKDDITEHKPSEGGDSVPKIEAVTRRYWFPMARIAKVFSHQETVIEGEVPVTKYHKFKSRGIDMIHQAVSQTVVDVNKVSKEISKDPHVVVAEQKAARLAGKKKKSK